MVAPDNKNIQIVSLILKGNILHSHASAKHSNSNFSVRIWAAQKHSNLRNVPKATFAMFLKSFWLS
jgi:hypothetical protein